MIFSNIPPIYMDYFSPFIIQTSPKETKHVAIYIKILKNGSHLHVGGEEVNAHHFPHQ